MTGDTNGFLKAIGSLLFLMMSTIYSFSHAAFLLDLPKIINNQISQQTEDDGMFGVLVWLMYVTEWNDIFNVISSL